MHRTSLANLVALNTVRH